LRVGQRLLALSSRPCPFDLILLIELRTGSFPHLGHLHDFIDKFFIPFGWILGQIAVLVTAHASFKFLIYLSRKTRRLSHTPCFYGYRGEVRSTLCLPVKALQQLLHVVLDLCLLPGAALAHTNAQAYWASIRARGAPGVPILDASLWIYASSILSYASIAKPIFAHCRCCDQ
jgi:hypothetical protein